MLHYAPSHWDILVLWIHFIRTQVPDLHVEGVEHLEGGHRFSVDLEANEILFDASGPPRDQWICLLGAVSAYSLQLAWECSRTSEQRRRGQRRHLRLVDPPTAPFARPPAETAPFPVPQQRQFGEIEQPAGEVS